MSVIVEESGDIVILRMSGRFDTSVSPFIEKKFNNVLNSGCKRMILSMTDIDYISSAIIRVILFLHNRITESGGNVVISTPSQEVSDVLEMTGLDDVLLICNSEKESIARV